MVFILSMVVVLKLFAGGGQGSLACRRLAAPFWSIGRLFRGARDVGGSAPYRRTC
jgi:hypothetical protein